MVEILYIFSTRIIISQNKKAENMTKFYPKMTGVLIFCPTKLQIQEVHNEQLSSNCNYNKI